MILYSKLGNENFDVSYIKCSHGLHLTCGLQVPHPCFNGIADFIHNLFIMEELLFSTRVHPGGLFYCHDRPSCAIGTQCKC